MDLPRPVSAVCIHGLTGRSRRIALATLANLHHELTSCGMAVSIAICSDIRGEVYLDSSLCETAAASCATVAAPGEFSRPCWLI
jgi:hypothetical protein